MPPPRRKKTKALEEPGSPSEVKPGDGGSDTVRVSSDMKRMVKWICEIENISSVELMDWACRDRITSRFAPFAADVENEERIEAEKKARLEELKRKAKQQGSPSTGPSGPGEAPPTHK